MNDRLIWSHFDVPVLPKPASFEAALTALATLDRHPHIVLEASGSDGRVSWRVGARPGDIRRIQRALAAHLGPLSSTPVPSTPDGLLRADLTAQAKFIGAGALPLNLDLTASVVRGLLAALSSARRAESLHLQLVLGPRRRPRFTADVQRPTRQPVTLKNRHHRLQCAVRLAARTSDDGRARTLIHGLASALRLLESPGVRLRITRASSADFTQGRAPWFWANTLSTADLVPLTAWPLGEHPLPGVASPHPRYLPLRTSLPDRGRVLGRIERGEQAVALSNEDSLRHLHLLGPTGVGKSTVMANLAVADMAAGHGVVVIDPKGDLVSDLLSRIPTSRLDDVVVLDPQDGHPVGLNGLTGDPDLAADTMLAIFHSLYADAWGPRTHDILHASLLTLTRRGDASLALIPTLLTNPGFRRSIVGPIGRADPLGLGSFWAWYEGVSDAERLSAIAPLLNKLRPVLLRPGIRGVLGQRRPRFDMSDVFTKRRILLVSLAKGRLGPEAAQLLGSLVVGLVWNAALSRAATSAPRYPVMLHIDEVQDYLRLPGDLSDALAQGRSLGLGLSLAHQTLAQLTPSIREAILSNARSRLCFTLGHRDARDIAAMTRGALEADDFTSLPAFAAYASLLHHNAASDWFSMSTQPMVPTSSVPQIVRARSAALYGRALADVEAELLGFAAPSRGDDEPLGRTRRSDRGSS